MSSIPVDKCLNSSAGVLRPTPDDQLYVLTCPHCQSETAHGQEEYEQTQTNGTTYIWIGLVFLFLGTITIVAFVPVEQADYYILYFGVFFAGLYFLVRGLSLRYIPRIPVV